MDLNNKPDKPLSHNGLQLSYLGVVIIVLSIIASMFSFTELRSICVCISNFIVWGWISLVLSSLVGLFYPFFSKAEHILWIYSMQILLFFIGLVLMLIFGARVLDVI